MAGFEVAVVDEGYAWVHHGAAEMVHLRLVPGRDAATNAASCYFNVAAADAWHTSLAKFRHTDRRRRGPPRQKRELSFRDTGGNLIRVGHNL